MIDAPRQPSDTTGKPYERFTDANLRDALRRFRRQRRALLRGSCNEGSGIAGYARRHR